MTYFLLYMRKPINKFKYVFFRDNLSEMEAKPKSIEIAKMVIYRTLKI